MSYIRRDGHLIVASQSKWRIQGARDRYANMAAAVHSISPDTDLGFPETENDPLPEAILKVLAVARALNLPINSEAEHLLLQKQEVRPLIQFLRNIAVAILAGDVFFVSAENLSQLNDAQPLTKLGLELNLDQRHDPIARADNWSRYLTDLDWTIEQLSRPHYAGWMGANALHYAKNDTQATNALKYCVVVGCEPVPADEIVAAYRNLLALQIGPRYDVLESIVNGRNRGADIYMGDNFEDAAIRISPEELFQLVRQGLLPAAYDQAFIQEVSSPQKTFAGVNVLTFSQ